MRGLARVKPHNPDSSALATSHELWLTPRGATQATRFEVREIRPHRGLFLAALEGMTSPEDLAPWIGSRVEIELTTLPEPGEDELYHFEALGLEVYTTDGERIGVVEEVLPLKANDVWVVRGATPDGKAREVLIPVVGDIVVEIDLTERRVRIDPLPGLIDDGRS